MKPLVLMLLTAILSLPLHSADFVPDPFPPARFTSLYIEKDDKETVITIQLTGDAVTYTNTVGNKVVENITVHPAGDDWFNFIQGLNSAKVYKWAPKYDYPAQGVSWIIDLTMEDRKFTSAGTNDYPKEGAESDSAADPSGKPSLPFQLFWQASLALVGKGAPPAPAK